MTLRPNFFPWPSSSIRRTRSSGRLFFLPLIGLLRLLDGARDKVSSRVATFLFGWPAQPFDGRNSSQNSVFNKSGTVSTLEDALMRYQMNGIGRSPLLAASILLCGLFVAGCADHTDAIPHPNPPYLKGCPSPWKPASP